MSRPRLLVRLPSFVRSRCCRVRHMGAHARAGQQTVEFQGGIPVAPTGLAGHKLPAKPVEFDTGEGQRIRVSAVTRALEFPWAPRISSRRHHARHRTRRALAGDSKRRARSPACQRRSGVGTGQVSRDCLAPCTATWTSRSTRSSRRTGSSICLYTKPLDEKKQDRGHRARTFRREGADRGEGHPRPGSRRHVAHRVRT